MTTTTSQVRYFAGLDLGQAQEFTALAVLEQTKERDSDAPHRHVKHYAVRHRERFPLGTPYPEVGARLAQLFDTPALGGADLAVDQTMVGPPVVKLLCRSGIDARISAFTVTAGHVATTDERGDWLVPKKELASTVQVLLQSRRMKVADSLAEAPTLVKELLNFKLK